MEKVQRYDSILDSNSLTQDIPDNVIFLVTTQEVWEDLRDCFSQTTLLIFFRLREILLVLLKIR